MTALDDARVETQFEPSTDAWIPVCALDELIVGRGVAALVGSSQVAVFRLSAGDEPDLRALLQRYLSDQGYAVRTVDGAGPLDALAAQAPLFFGVFGFSRFAAAEASGS